MKHWRPAFGFAIPLAATLVLVVGPSPAPAAPSACAPALVTVVADGKTQCVAASSFRVVAAPASPGELEFRSTIAGSPIALRDRHGAVITEIISPTLAAAAETVYVSAETKLIAAIRAAQPKHSSRGASGLADDHVSLNLHPDGTGTGTISRTVEADGQTLKMEVEVGARRQGDTVALDVGVSATFDDGSGTATTRGFQLRDLNLKPSPTCPTATGKIDIEQHLGVTKTSTDVYGGARVKLGTVRESVSVDLTATAHAQLGPDARLQPYTISADIHTDFSRSAQALVILSRHARVAGTATFTGSVDPSTGAVSGATATSTATISGFDADGAKAVADYRAGLQSMLQEEAGKIQTKLKAIETRARSGGCTKIVFAPTSPAPLAPSARQSVTAHLETAPEGLTVGTVRWAAVAVKGSVSPTTSRDAQPTLKVTGNAKGPQTAVINVKAVSPAGVSQKSWIGKEEGYSARWSGSGLVITGAVPDLAAPFTLAGTFPGGSATFSYSPSSDHGGTLKIAGGGSGAKLTGSGTYKVTPGTKDTLLLTEQTHACVDVSGVCRDDTHQIVLTPAG